MEDFGRGRKEYPAEPQGDAGPCRPEREHARRIVREDKLDRLFKGRLEKPFEPWPVGFNRKM